VTDAWTEAKKHLAGGVNSPVRAFKAVGGKPVFMQKGLGPFIYDNRGRRYVDHCLSWGALIWGHAYQPTVEALQRQAAKGTSFGTVTEYETALAVEIKKAFPRMETLRFTSSGTEAVMAAVRLARGVTRRDRIVKFEGCYHGHADSLLVKAGSGLATFGRPDSRGVPAAVAALTSVLPYNDERALRAFFNGRRDVACVLVEPVAGNMGVIPAAQNFLRALRQESKKSGALLIFDEVITGYRLCYGGAQHVFGIEPDITVLGKIVGGGLPVGVFGAKKSLMSALSPEGGVYQAGTLSGNPLAMAAGLSVLSGLSPAFYKQLNATAGYFLKQADRILRRKKMCARLQSAGSMFTPYFSSRPVRNFRDASGTDKKAFNRFFHKMLSQGVYFPPSSFEASFLSAAHGSSELDGVLAALSRC